MTMHDESAYDIFEAGPCGGKIAVVMAPVMAAWDGGAFCAPLASLLIDRGYRLSIYDTMSVARNCADLPAAAARWGAILRARHAAIDLAVGQAYGGALVQYMLCDALVACPRVLAVSAPTYCDEALRDRLSGVLRRLLQGDPAGAVRELDWLVQADSLPTLPAGPTTVPAGTVRRLRTGLSHLCAADARAGVAAYPGRILWIYGEASRLVRRANIVPGADRRLQRAVGLPRCGMRPFADDHDAAIALVQEFLE